MMTAALNLRKEAEAEARRLAAARALDRPGCGRRRVDDFETSGPLIARARGFRLRKMLAGRTLLIWRIACEDAAGRTLPATIVAMLASIQIGPYPDETRARVRNLIEAIDSGVPDMIGRVLRARQHDLAEIAGAHAAARLARERAIADSVGRTKTAAPAWQAGLFDRRSERAHGQQASDADEAEQRISARAAAARAAATISPGRPALLLVLTP